MTIPTKTHYEGSDGAGQNDIGVDTSLNTDDVTQQVQPVVIAGAGIVGLVLSLALEKHLGIKPVIYDQAKAFHDGVGKMNCDVGQT